MTVFMPGPMTSGHHQIGVACGACHTEAFGGRTVLQEACVECHGPERQKPFDSHPKTKFTDPRNADRLEKIDAVVCMTCHVEHRPDITRPMGLTQAGDFCFYCHDDIGDERPSHAGMAFDTCADAGCHNFHDNRALYTDFLIKHLHEPEILDKVELPKREFADVLDEIITYPHDTYPVQALAAADADAPEPRDIPASVMKEWLGTAHAKAGVNCTACHKPRNAEGVAGEWTDHPDHTGCVACHDAEVAGFFRGKHGMRIKQGLSAMTPAMARLPMKADAADKTLGCVSCHRAHDFDTRRAAVEACLSCHDDEHSLAYKGSPHYALWEKELAGEAPAGTGVSCATCHLPRVDFDANDWLRRVLVEHNQNATLTPNEKMIRPACLHCHGLEFSIDAQADRELVERNYTGRPSAHVESMDMAERVHRQHLEETEGLD